MVLYINTSPYAIVYSGLKCGQYIDSSYLILKFNFYLEEWQQTGINDLTEYSWVKQGLNHSFHCIACSEKQEVNKLVDMRGLSKSS